MNELCFLGTGGSIPHKNRNNTSLALSLKGETVLIDCPGDAFNKMKRLGLDPRRISSIFITHIHPDHVCGLPALIHSLMLDEISILLYGSGETIHFCENLLGLFNLLNQKVKCRIQFEKIKPNMSFQIHSNVQAYSIKIPHHSSSLAVYFDLRDDNLGLLYSGDTPAYTPLFKHSRSLDVLIHDCSAPSRFFKKYPSLSQMHTHSLDLGKMACQAGVKCLIPIHFFGELDYSMKEIEREIVKNYKNRLVIPHDLEKLPLSASLLSKKDKT